MNELSFVIRFLSYFCTIFKILRRKSDFFDKKKKSSISLLTMLFNTMLDICHVLWLYYPTFWFYDFLINFKLYFIKRFLWNCFVFLLPHTCVAKKSRRYKLGFLYHQQSCWTTCHNIMLPVSFPLMQKVATIISASSWVVHVHCPFLVSFVWCSLYSMTPTLFCLKLGNLCGQNISCDRFMQGVTFYYVRHYF